MNTKFYDEFILSINIIQQKMQPEDLFLNKLFFANVITSFEVYLQSVFVDLLKQDKELLKKLTLSSKYKNNKISLNKALTNDMMIYLSELIKNIVFHNLSDIEPLFKEVLGVNINYKSDDKILKSIEKRHDIIHRNGKTKESLTLEISNSELDGIVDIFKKLISDVDSQIISKYPGVNI